MKQQAGENEKERQLNAPSIKPIFTRPKPLRQPQNAFQCTSESEARNKHPS